MSDRDVLVVQADSPDGPQGWAVLGDRRWRCAVGGGGIREDKVEGDGATPAGTYPLRRILYRNDRLVLPAVPLPSRPINEHDGWCDDPRAPTYNRLVRVPNEWSHERLWRDDGLYDLIVVVGYNDEPPEGEWGSAIFLHVARPDYAGTQGCIAFARDDLLELVTLIGPQTRVRILPEARDAADGDGAASEDPDMKLFEDFDERDW